MFNIEGLKSMVWGGPKSSCDKFMKERRKELIELLKTLRNETNDYVLDQKTQDMIKRLEDLEETKTSPVEDSGYF